MRVRTPRPLDVAIVGMACRFPGAPDLFTFWENILAGKASLSDARADRREAGDRVTGRCGGYLGEPIPIDPATHGIVPNDLDGVEPEPHLVLEAARAALADAGLADGATRGRRVDVIVGRGSDFHRGDLTRLQHGRIAEQTVAVARALRPDLSEDDLRALHADLRSGPPPFDAATAPGRLPKATAEWVANRLDLRGASLVVDAASASSLVALDLGARAVAGGRADLAIVGGVYVLSDVDLATVVSRLGTLSRSGQPRPFGRDADGLVPGEGVGVVVLKRRADAERDGDRVYAVLQAVGLASDGWRLGLAAPGARGRALAMRRAYRRAGIDPATVGLIEGHGLGVPAADRAELRALRAVFPPSSDRAIGAVSSMIGHAMPASGVAGLIKTALSLYHRALPPTLGADDPHPLLLREDRPGTPNRATRPWVHGDPATPRRAGVNAFGFAGINAHAVLEEPPAAGADQPGCLLRWDTEAVLLGAPDRAALGHLMTGLADRVGRRPDVALKDLASTLNTAAGSGPARLGLVVGSAAELVERLRSLAPRLAAPGGRAVRDGRGVYFREDADPPPPLAVVFPGEGSQYPGMLGDLALHFPTVLALLDTSDRLAREAGAADLPSRLLYGEGAAEGRGLWSIGPAVNVVLSAQRALYGLLGGLGVRPGAVVGHSSGEFLALAAAGAVRVDRAFEDAMGRLGGLFERMEASGEVPEAALLAVAAGRDRLAALAPGWPIDLAIDNCPHQVVVAGDREAVGRFERVLGAEGILFETLPFSRGYHTPAFARAVGPLRRLLDGLDVSPPSIPIYSCASAGPMPRDPAALRDLAADQWARPVRFRETVERMHADGYRTFVDVGPRGHLAGFVEDTLRGREANALAMGMPRRSGTAQLNHLVAALFSLGYAPRTDTLYARRRPARVDLDAAPPALPTTTLRLGFPALRVSDAMAERLRPAPAPAPGPTAAAPDGPVVPSREGGDPDGAMVEFTRTMDLFLDTQREVMSAYLRPVEAPAPEVRPGPWAGEVVAIEAGRRVVTRYRLDAVGDPVAAHHTLGGRRVSAVEPGRLGLPVLPFAVMAEMLAQAAGILAPGEVLIALRGVAAHRWIRYEDAPVALEIEALRDPDRPGEVRAAVYNLGPFDAPRAREAAAVEGTAVFAARGDGAVTAAPFSLPGAGVSRFTAESLYGEQWLFHGPALRAVTRVGAISDAGVEGRLRVLPRGPLLRDPGEASRLYTDPIVLDNFTHLLGCWGLDRLDGGDVVFPLSMGELALSGDAPGDGEEVECRILVRGLEHHRVGVDAEIVRGDGTTWMRITGWEDWRFHWPARYRDVFRRPDAELLAEELTIGADPATARAVWLQPPADMGRPVWRDVLEQTQLSPAERAGIAVGPEPRRSLRLWGRIAAKDAARRLRLAGGGGPVFPADLEILPDRHGRPVLRSLLDPDRADPAAAVSIAHTEGVALAVATTDPEARPGVDVERVVPRPEGFEAVAFSPGERSLLDLAARGGDRPEWVARFWCAKEAAAKATGLGLADGPGGGQVVGLGPGAGDLLVGLGPGADAAIPGPRGEPVRVTSARRGEYVWAWTLGERSANR